MRVTTETGSVYEFTGGSVRRVNDTAQKRADGSWVRLITMFPKTPEVGYSMVLVLESLSALGPDDDGRELHGGSTTRTTSRVTRVES